MSDSVECGAGGRIALAVLLLASITAAQGGEKAPLRTYELGEAGRVEIALDKWWLDGKMRGRGARDSVGFNSTPPANLNAMLKAIPSEGAGDPLLTDEGIRVFIDRIRGQMPQGSGPGEKVTQTPVKALPAGGPRGYFFRSTTSPARPDEPNSLYLAVFVVGDATFIADVACDSAHEAVCIEALNAFVGLNRKP